MSSLLDAALYYARLGWPVFPCAPRGKRPLTPHGCRDGSTDEATIRAWWQRWPEANIGMLCGAKGGVSVLDVDVERDDAGQVIEDGWASLRKLEDEHGELPRTVKSRTPRGGAHFIFRADPPPACKNDFRKGIDVRGDGYYIIMPPSIHPNGGVYAWDVSPEDMQPAELPDWLRPEREAKPVTPAAPLRMSYQVTDDERLRRASAYLTRMDPAVQGAGGHNRLYAAATAMIHGFELSPAEAYELLAGEFNPRCSPPWDLNDKRDRRDFERKIDEALKQPHAQPRGWLLRAPDAQIGDHIHGAQVAATLSRQAANGTAAATQARPQRRLTVRRGVEIDDEGNEYIWRRRLVRGAINVIFSRPGRGKSTLAADLAGHVTLGRTWPDGSPCPRGDVLYIKGEGTDASIRDRMHQAGADPERYVIVGHASDGQTKSMIDLATDIDLVAQVLADMPETKLVIVDTLDSLYPSMRMIDNGHIRKCLWPLQELAEAWNLCVVVFAHTNKGGYADPLDRLSGGRAIGGAARSVWYLGKLGSDSDECYFASCKVNDFVPAPTLAYTIEGDSPDMPGVIRWGAVREDVTAWELDRPEQSNSGSNKSDKAAEWLEEYLRDGPKPVWMVNDDAKDAGFGRKAITRAKETLRCEAKKQKGSMAAKWYLCLPGQEPPPVPDSSGGPFAKYTPNPMTLEGGEIG